MTTLGVVCPWGTTGHEQDETKHRVQRDLHAPFDRYDGARQL